MKRDHETSGSGADSKHGARSSTKPSSAPSRVRSVLNLQRTAGNRAVSSRLAGPAPAIPIQRNSDDLIEAIGKGATSTNLKEVADTLMDVIGESDSNTNLASSLRGSNTHGGKDETPKEAGDTPEKAPEAGSAKKYTRTPAVTEETLKAAKEKAFGEYKQTQAEIDTDLQSRYTAIATIRSSHKKLFGAELDQKEAEKLSDLKGTTDDAFTTISSRYKTLAPLASKYEKAYGKKISSGEIDLPNDAKTNLTKLLDPSTSDEDFASFQTELTSKAKSATDLEEIKRLENSLAKSDLHLHPKSDAELKAMLPQKQATYLKYLKKKADEVNADEEDTFAQQEFNKQLLKGGVKTKEQRAAEQAAKKK